MIYKGCYKKIIVLKNTGSELFDEAYLFLNEKCSKADSMSETDMIREANKIVSNELIGGYFQKEKDKDSTGKKNKTGIIDFLLGLFAGIVLSFGTVLILR